MMLFDPVHFPGQGSYTVLVTVYTNRLFYSLNQPTCESFSLCNFVLIKNGNYLTFLKINMIAPQTKYF